MTLELNQYASETLTTVICFTVGLIIRAIEKRRMKNKKRKK